MKHLVTPIMRGAFLLIGSTGLALAANVHTATGTTGQPSQHIGSVQTGSATPGNAASSPGSAFNPNGTAGTHYAGNVPQSSKNPKSVSQYDVAGFQQSHNH
ncbi:adenylate cyclase [Rhizobium jaguaris]|uniref:adenylate cyclase n=1 Tax=Rhizobium jaguaris TaxID=1312183 RepID=UPI0019695469|nr:adenylate cyclase [Rhizobium jaguaris]